MIHIVTKIIQKAKTFQSASPVLFPHICYVWRKEEEEKTARRLSPAANNQPAKNNRAMERYYKFERDRWSTGCCGC